MFLVCELPNGCCNIIFGLQQFFLFFQERYRGQDRHGRLPLNEGYLYYPRFYPTYQWDQGTYNMSANGVEGGQFYSLGDDGKRIEGGAYSGHMYDNMAYVGHKTSRHTGSYKLPSELSLNLRQYTHMPYTCIWLRLVLSH